jgi:hypothetical protein
LAFDVVISDGRDARDAELFAVLLVHMDADDGDWAPLTRMGRSCAPNLGANRPKLALQLQQAIVGWDV